MIGLSLLPFGAALIVRYFGVASRAAFTAVGLFLLFIWLLPQAQFRAIFGNHGDGDFEMFFLSGIFLVFGAVARRGAGAGFEADPVPQALVITGIVVAFSASALAVALLKRLAEPRSDDA